MIKIHSIHIQEFRGIRDLQLSLDGDNFGICGPNGTGKSGVVDAIEFCLTGDVTRLSGHGTSGISVKNHAPHVDQRTNPENAWVSITGYIPSLDSTITIRRSVKKPNNPEISPDNIDVLSIADELKTHPEFALSRREIVKYIITPPGQRSVDVQTLLRLDHIEKLRKSLKTTCNKRKSEADEAERNKIKAETDLINALYLESLDSDHMLEKINQKRTILGLPKLTELSKDSTFKSGIVDSTESDKKTGIHKTTAQADLSTLRLEIKIEEPTSLRENIDDALSKLKELRDDKQALMLARQHGFIKTGLDLITEDSCPLCDKPWKADDLKDHLNKKIITAEKFNTTIIQLQENIKIILESLSNRIQSIKRVIHYCQSFDTVLPHNEIEKYHKSIVDKEQALLNFQKDVSELKPTISSLKDSWWLPSKKEIAQIETCLIALDSLPDISDTEEARDTLSIAQDRYERYLQAEKEEQDLNSINIIAHKIMDHYNTTATEVLESVYDQVAKDFSTFYCSINREDEDEFVGTLTSQPAKLRFDVDFYGRGLFPPGAYHSEGHQDAMGLCLYLALMRHTLKDGFTFAVLDDVLMSVDTNHRRAVCRLLKNEFQKTQFILTTHDRVWLQYMKTENLISKSKSFAGWTVDSGPRVLDDHDIWTEIQEELDKEDVAQAAWLLRRYLEFTAIILADNLRARIEFRGDGNYGLGDLMPHVVKRWRKLLEDGEKSAIKWKREEDKTSIAEMRIAVKDLTAKTNAEQWAINPTVHFNEWSNFQASEFKEVVDAFKDLLHELRCTNPACLSFLSVSPIKGQPEVLRCNCGKTTINLII